MKKYITLTLALALCAGMMVPASAAKTVLSTQNLTVDGQPVVCEKYNIDGSNYFKLRDLAAALQDTGSQFGVGYDAASNTVTISTHADYTANGTELKVGSDKSATARPSAQTILIDGVAVSDISVYNIGGNNYFKLRDLGEKLGFEVGYSEATRTATVESAYDYKAVCTYDAKGNRISETSYQPGSDPFTTLYTYDDNGNKLTSRDADDPKCGTDYTYDAHGSCVKEVYSNGAEKYISTAEFRYDSAGRIISEVQHNADMEDYSYEYTYDAGGNVLTEIYRADGFTMTTANTYSNGLLKSSAISRSSGENASVEYAYDAAGNVVSETWKSSDGSSVVYSFAYDQHGNETLYQFKDNDGNVFTKETRYTYDAKGNAVKSVSMDSDLMSTITICTYDDAGNQLSIKTCSSAG